MCSEARGQAHFLSSIMELANRFELGQIEKECLYIGKSCSSNKHSPFIFAGFFSLLKVQWIH